MNIFGHNIFNLGPSPKKSSNNFKRFEELMNFIYHDFAQENKYIQFTINGKDYVYKIFGFEYELELSTVIVISSFYVLITSAATSNT